jgi:hypothetical protein
MAERLFSIWRKAGTEAWYMDSGMAVDHLL